MKTKHVVIMSVAVIAVLAGAILHISSSFAESHTTQKQNHVQASSYQGTQASTVDTDNVQNNNGNDRETNDDHNSVSEGPNGDGDGEQKDSTESGK